MSKPWKAMQFTVEHTKTRDMSRKNTFIVAFPGAARPAEPMEKHSKAYCNQAATAAAACTTDGRKEVSSYAISGKNDNSAHVKMINMETCM